MSAAQIVVAVDQQWVDDLRMIAFVVDLGHQNRCSSRDCGCGDLELLALNLANLADAALAVAS